MKSKRSLCFLALSLLLLGISCSNIQKHDQSIINHLSKKLPEVRVQLQAGVQKFKGFETQSLWSGFDQAIKKASDESEESSIVSETKPEPEVQQQVKGFGKSFQPREEPKQETEVKEEKQSSGSRSWAGFKVLEKTIGGKQEQNQDEQKQETFHQGEAPEQDSKKSEEQENIDNSSSQKSGNPREWGVSSQNQETQQKLTIIEQENQQHNQVDQQQSSQQQSQQQEQQKQQSQQQQQRRGKQSSNDQSQQNESEKQQQNDEVKIELAFEEEQGEEGQGEQQDLGNTQQQQEQQQSQPKKKETDEGIERSLQIIQQIKNQKSQEEEEKKKITVEYELELEMKDPEVVEIHNYEELRHAMNEDERRQKQNKSQPSAGTVKFDVVADFYSEENEDGEYEIKVNLQNTLVNLQDQLNSKSNEDMTIELDASQLLSFLKTATQNVNPSSNKPPPERSIVKERERKEEEEKKKIEEQEQAKQKPAIDIVVGHEPIDDMYENTVNNLRKKYMTRHSSEEEEDVVKPYQPVADTPIPQPDQNGNFRKPLGFQSQKQEQSSSSRKVFKQGESPKQEEQDQSIQKSSKQTQQQNQNKENDGVIVGDLSEYFKGYVVLELVKLYDRLDETEKRASSGSGHREDDYIDREGNEYQDDDEGNTYIFLDNGDYAYIDDHRAYWYYLTADSSSEEWWSRNEKGISGHDANNNEWFISSEGKAMIKYDKSGEVVKFQVKTA